MESLIGTIRQLVAIPDKELVKISRIVTNQRLKKGDTFVQAGTIPPKLAFVEQGLFRYYYLNDEGREFTKGFFPAGGFISSYTAMITNRPSYYTIEALEDSSLMVFSYTDWLTLQRNYGGWNLLLIAMLEKGYAKKEMRERELLLLSARERYESFLKNYPGLENRVRQHLIASYLGITPVALSRIRNGKRS